MTLSGPSGRIGRVPTMSYSPVLRTRLGVSFTMGLLPRRLAPPSWGQHGAQVTMPAMCPERITVFFEALSRLWQRPWIEALVGFQGRGCADGVQPDFCHPLLLEALLFQWPSK